MVHVSTENIRPGRSGGKVLAEVDVRVGDRLLIRGVRLVEGRDGRFLSMPARKVDETWVPIIELSPELHQQVTDAVVAQLRDWRPNLSPAPRDELGF